MKERSAGNHYETGKQGIARAALLVEILRDSGNS